MPTSTIEILFEFFFGKKKRKLKISEKRRLRKEKKVMARYIDANKLQKGIH